ncbi:GntR family transcriptional regulator [Plastoroseomonas hellenica]|uniref:GntR family transcriptional regulator n=1 Tax=Plastoroseomonas hellenica TaxID=2687306 RepID=A0ABS5EVS1_9PROT|nr:GntR family transcriptional regulator [Plastoroseomonas hellenica]MBR0641382.1 GntR family transcriptional regulator [Plastoroseomonas hellenica]MBR0664401.1 GntR family transcriptional regulator [Plastoroseomonas hellenica]
MAFKTKQDQVAEIIRERILSGAYPRGTKLKQFDIAQDLEVSITPVREALHMLGAEGFVESVPHKGLIVPPVRLHESREIFELRLKLEGDLTARALARMNRATLTGLRESQAVIAALADGGTRLASRTENYRFHFRLYELADRPQTLQFIRVLWAKYPFIDQERGGRRLKHIDEHERFLRLVEAGDMEAAVDAMVAHIESGWRDLLASEAMAAAG